VRVKERAREDLAVFESHRPALVALAYRMLEDVGRAQDMVQEAWIDDDVSGVTRAQSHARGLSGQSCRRWHPPWTRG
jgi:hypothetical protein